MIGYSVKYKNAKSRYFMNINQYAFIERFKNARFTRYNRKTNGMLRYKIDRHFILFRQLSLMRTKHDRKDKK